MITANWTAAHSVSNISAFHVFVNATQVGETNSSTLHYSVYGLVNSTAYTFQVRAVFKAGSTATALESNLVTAPTSSRSRPSQMSPPTLVGVGGGLIKILTQLPQDSGGASIQSLTAIARSTVDFSVVTLTQPATQLAFKIYGVSARTGYLVSVYATNEDNQSGPASESLRVKTTELRPAGPCPPPTVLAVTGVWARICDPVAFMRLL